MQKAAPSTVNAYELDVKYQTWRKDIICIAFTYWKQKLHTKAEFLQWNGSDLLPTLFFFFCLYMFFFVVFYIPVVMLNKGFVKGSEQKDFRCVSCSFLLIFFIFMISHNYYFFFFLLLFLVKSIYKVLKTNSIKCH